jgi:quaternary ammonium compound-resistance protein SugE
VCLSDISIGDACDVSIGGLHTAGTLAAMALSVALLGLTLRWLPLGTAYAVWTGVGMVGTALLGIVLFEEPADLVRMLCISVIMAGIVGLKLVSPH